MKDINYRNKKYIRGQAGKALDFESNIKVAQHMYSMEASKKNCKTDKVIEDIAGYLYYQMIEDIDDYNERIRDFESVICRNVFVDAIKDDLKNLLEK